MSKKPPVRTRCPYCHRFHYAHGKGLSFKINVNNMIGMGLLMSMIQHDPDLHEAKMKLNKLIPEDVE